MAITPIYRYPDVIVEAASLLSQLDDPGLRIFECTTYLIAPDEQSPYTVVSGRQDYLSAHIPGAAYLDLQNSLSVGDSPYRFTLPALDSLTARFAAAGIDDSTRVVLYSRGSAQWASRIWWMLRAIGFDNAGILNGGWKAWQAQGGPIAADECSYAPGSLTNRPRDNLFVGKHEVLAAMRSSQTRVINALSASMHAGHNRRYGRPGRIPGSKNVPAASLLDTNSGRFVDATRASELFAGTGVSSDKPAIIYCGGGIAATLDAFILHQLGFEDIAVYDNSLNEWANDPSLPIEQD